MHSRNCIRWCSYFNVFILFNIPTFYSSVNIGKHYQLQSTKNYWNQDDISGLAFVRAGNHVHDNQAAAGGTSESCCSLSATDVYCTQTQRRAAQLSQRWHGTEIYELHQRGKHSSSIIMSKKYSSIYHQLSKIVIHPVTQTFITTTMTEMQGNIANEQRDLQYFSNTSGEIFNSSLLT